MLAFPRSAQSVLAKWRQPKPAPEPSRPPDAETVAQLWQSLTAYRPPPAQHRRSHSGEGADSRG